MCHQVRCTPCGKPTWAGCGAHVEQALRDVAPEKRCQCPQPRSILARLLGRRASPARYWIRKCASNRPKEDDKIYWHWPPATIWHRPHRLPGRTGSVESGM